MDALGQELDQARKQGPVRDIIIPPCPDLLIRLQNAMATGEPDLAEIDRIAGADVAMSAALIRQANSPFYALEQPVHTVGQALTVVGLQPSVRLLSGFLVRGAIRTTSTVLDHFWESSTRRALACEHIAAQLYNTDSSLAYSFGLFCHVGIPVMMQGVKGYGSTLVEALARKDRSFVQTENANHRTDHAVVGAIVARTWRLPSDVAYAIRLHHDFSCLNDAKFSEAVRTLVAIGLVAEHLVLRFEQVPESREWGQYGAACLQHLAVEQTELELWEDQLHPVFADVQVG